jgi:hypothetical protein
MNMDEKAHRNAKMKLEYVNSDCTYNDIAKKYGISYESVKKIALKDQWRESRRDLKEKVISEAENKIATSLSDRRAELSVKHYDTWEKILSIVNDILDHKEEQLQYDSGQYKVGTLERIANILEKIQGGQRLATGLANALDLRKVVVAEQKLNLERKKASGEITVPENDGFIDAMNAQVDEVWGDDNGNDE